MDVMSTFPTLGGPVFQSNTRHLLLNIFLCTYRTNLGDGFEFPRWSIGTGQVDRFSVRKICRTWPHATTHEDWTLALATVGKNRSAMAGTGNSQLRLPIQASWQRSTRTTHSSHRGPRPCIRASRKLWLALLSYTAAFLFRHEKAKTSNPDS